jgi:ATP-dependent Clp protease adaptor protein ClpS
LCARETNPSFRRKGLATAAALQLSAVQMADEKVPRDAKPPRCQGQDFWLRTLKGGFEAYTNIERMKPEVMSISRSPSVTTESSLPEVAIKTREKEKKQTRRVPPYNVILENDDHHTMEFVVESLQKALGYSQERAYQLTMQAHMTGRCVVWTGPKEVAELKADQIRTFHEVHASGANLGPLSCYIEPAPGG